MYSFKQVQIQFVRLAFQKNMYVADGNGERIHPHPGNKLGGLIGIGKPGFPIVVSAPHGAMPQFGLYVDARCMGCFDDFSCYLHILIKGEVGRIKHDRIETLLDSVHNLIECDCFVQKQCGGYPGFFSKNRPTYARLSMPTPLNHASFIMIPRSR